MIKEKLQAKVEQAIEKALADEMLLTKPTVEVIIERPRLPEHGDFACGIAMKLASVLKTAPQKIAETIAAHIEVDGDKVALIQVAAPGFINFHLGHGWLRESLSEISAQADQFGRSKMGVGQKVLIEYVSANPTGDLHIGHGRNAVYGSCLANLLKFTGHTVEQEFYVNDTGEQIAQLSKCAWALYQRKLGVAVEYPTEGYPEDSLEEFVDHVIAEHGKIYLDLGQAQGESKLGDLTKNIIMHCQKQLLSKLRIDFDCWYSEASLHEGGAVNDVLNQFAQSGISYESEGALWLKAKDLGDERDRVLRKTGGNTTYLANDAAYHLDKYSRGYTRLINIWGADHHGQVPGLKAVVQALGKDPVTLEVILTQIVNLSRDGQIVRMSKRKGTVVTLSEVMDEVGVDAVRYYLAESNPQNPINFDLELAKQTSRENPAFYIQYAHARCCAILRKLLEPQINTETGKQEQPLITSRQWAEFQNSYKSDPKVFEPLFESDVQIFAHQKALIIKLDSFPEEVVEAVCTRTPGRLARYAYELANDLQKFYELCRVITIEPEITKARLGLVLATRQVLANSLGIIGVSTPERM